jgi:glycosyltransferase involved in cell wall biosynthesis
MNNVSVIIPALNEEEPIAVSFGKSLRQNSRDIIVVDNGSTDQTANRAREAGVAL